jgi:O-methyltransferase
MFEPARPKPAPADCFFYHVMQLPQAGRVGGEWDIMPYYEEYVGGVALSGRTVLDVGTASGQVGFEAERRGARVTAFDLASAAQIAMVPFAGHTWHEDRAGWNEASMGFVRSLHNAWWFAWHEYRSAARVAYGELSWLARELEPQDVVIAGAFIEHMSDPVTALGHLCRLAREEVVVGFTPLAPGPGRYLRPITEWRPETAFAWWELSADLYRAVFDACGFTVDIHPARALHRADGVAHRHTLVARRRG